MTMTTDTRRREEGDRRMRTRAALCLLLLMTLAAGTAAADALRLTGELCGSFCYPEGADEAEAAYVYRYAYPQVEALTEAAQTAAEAINELYAYTVRDTRDFTVPVNGEQLDPAFGQAETAVTFEITCTTDDWFSLLIRTASTMNGYESVIYAGHVFAVQSEKPGNVITLPYLLGILAEGENDTWLQDRQTAKADACVRQMVWERLQEMAAAGEVGILPDVDFDMFSGMFYPEEDFYLDAEGEPVFFLEPGFVAAEEDGLLRFPMTVEEIQDEI